jgi:hypothetical protein
MDLSKLSEADLSAIASGDMTKVSDEGLTHISSQPPEVSDPRATRAPAVVKPEPSSGKAAAAGVSQGLTFGYTPQIVGGIASLLGKAQDYFNPVKDPSTGATIPRVDYTKARDATTHDIDEAKSAHPGAYFGGALAGSAAPGALAAKATKGLGLVKGGALAGAAIGSLSNPGDKEGVVHNPLEGDFQGDDRAVNAGIGAGAGAALGGLSQLIGKGAKHAQDFRDLKSGAMADRATQAIDDAAAAINEKQISPRDEQLRGLVGSKSFEVNPDRVAPVFPRLGSKMAQGLEADASPQGLSIAGGAEAQAPQRAILSGDRALRLKRAADAAADYGASKPFDPAATAQSEEAKSLADILRRQINADPKAAQLNEEMGQYSALRDALTKREGTAPIETLQAPLGSSRQAILSKVDQAAGTNLIGLGKDVSSAKALELHPDRLVKPLELPSEIKAIGLRGAAELSRLLNKAPVGTKESLLNALIPTDRVK